MKRFFFRWFKFCALRAFGRRKHRPLQPFELLEQRRLLTSVSLAPTSVAEQDGAGATTATVTRADPNDVGSSIWVRLASNDTGEAVIAGGHATRYEAILRPENAVPPSNSTASGTAAFTLRSAGDSLALDYAFEFQGLDLDGLQTPGDDSDNVTGFHLHVGTPDINGQLIFGFLGPQHDQTDLMVDAAAGIVTGTWDISDVNFPVVRPVSFWLNELADGLIYVNVHTLGNPPGDIRGPLEALESADRLIEIPIGQASATVAIDAVEDLVFDGAQTVEIRASTPDLVDGVATLEVTDSTVFQVVQTTAVASRVDIELTLPVDVDSLLLYTGQQVGPDTPVVQLTGASVGPVRGSLAWDAPTSTVQFLPTGGPLEPDTYTLAVEGLLHPTGVLLDGDADRVDGGRFETQFTIEETTDRWLGLPDFARGPDQSVELGGLPGIPVQVDDSTGLEQVEFTLRFDPALLDISGAQLADGLPEGWQFDSPVNLNTPGQVTVSLSGTEPLAAGQENLVLLTGSVPESAEVGQLGLLQFTDHSLNNDGLAARVDDAVQTVAYFGDATGNGNYSGLDASLIARVAVELDTGFAAYPNIDPVLIGDVTGNGDLSALDASFVARRAVGLDQAEIPDLPGATSLVATLLSSPVEQSMASESASAAIVLWATEQEERAEEFSFSNLAEIVQNRTSSLPSSDNVNVLSEENPTRQRLDRPKRESSEATGEDEPQDSDWHASLDAWFNRLGTV